MLNPSNSHTASQRATGADRQLVFFGEDWGRHPSTAQYLASQLLHDFNVTWINSIGLREPSPSLADLNRIVGKIRRAVAGGSADSEAEPASEPQQDPQHLVSPWVVPLHRFSGVQRLNKALFQRQIARQTQLHSAPYSLVTANPASYYLLDTLTPDTSLYYCADKYAHIAGLNPKLVDRFERALLERVDCVAATSLPLVDDLAKHHNNVHYLPHGVDFERFNSTLGTEKDNPEAPPSTGEPGAPPVVGFIGLLGEHIDFSLIQACAQQLPDTHFLFVGPVEQGIRLPAAANIEYTGSVPQAQLPLLLRRMDICTLPYAMTARNHYANPTKVREYLASGRAVVATEQPGLKDIQGEVTVAADQASYVSALKQRLAEVTALAPAARRDLQDKIAAPMRQETWAARAAVLRGLLNGDR